MQATNQHKSQRSRCVYCGSVDYGRGCRYGPHGVHFHPDDSTKCAYCKSRDYGHGCRYNPTSDMHVHGVAYNNMFRENIQGFFDSEFLLRELKKEYTEFEAYKLGVIDDKGNKISEPVTEQQEAAFSPMVKTIIRLKKFLGPKLDLLEASSALEKTVLTESVDVDKYKVIVDYRDRVADIVNELYKTLDEAVAAGLSIEEAKRLIKA